MSQLRFFYTCDKNGGPRHVVVATSDEKTDGTIEVEYVGLHPAVVGAARRGRRPDFKGDVALSDLTEMQPDQVPSELHQMAETMLSPEKDTTETVSN